LDFYIEGKKLSILNFHSRPYNKDPESEIKALSNYVIDSFNSSLIVAGDFNVPENKSVFDALKKSGFKPGIENQKTTLKKKCDRVEYLNHAIDNIFYSKDIKKLNGKIIDFVKACDNLDESNMLSDHLPVQLVFSLVRN